MPAPTLTGFGADLYERMEPWAHADPDNGYALAWLCHAIGTQFTEVDAFALDWEATFDPDTAPAWALDWLAQFAGVRLTPGFTTAQRRAEIVSPTADRRGTPAAIRAVAALTLTGTARVRLTERDGSPYALSVRTYEAQTPDPVEAERLVRTQKPAGLVLTYDLALGWDWAELVAWNATENGGTWAGLVADTETDTWTEVAHHLDA